MKFLTLVIIETTRGMRPTMYADRYVGSTQFHDFNATEKFICMYTYCLSVSWCVFYKRYKPLLNIKPFYSMDYSVDI